MITTQSCRLLEHFPSIDEERSLSLLTHIFIHMCLYVPKGLTSVASDRSGCGSRTRYAFADDLKSSPLPFGQPTNDSLVISLLLLSGSLDYTCVFAVPLLVIGEKSIQFFPQHSLLIRTCNKELDTADRRLKINVDRRTQSINTHAHTDLGIQFLHCRGRDERLFFVSGFERYAIFSATLTLHAKMQ